MKQVKILEMLRAFIEQFPHADEFEVTSDNLKLLGETIAALKGLKDDFSLNHKLSFIQSHLSTPMMRYDSITELITIVHGAITEIELSMPHEVKNIYGPGATYDFYKNFKTLVTSAKSNLFLIDPYLNDEIFDLYVCKIQSSVIVKILTNSKHSSKSLPTVINKFKQQYGSTVEVRDSKELHDRVIFIDNIACWVIGQSIKDAAVKKTTYLAPLPSDIVNEKLQFYDSIWNSAPAI